MARLPRPDAEKTPGGLSPNRFSSPNLLSGTSNAFSLDRYVNKETAYASM